ncbi:hypothetical protein ACF0H5_004892 [Mactra antiquata]
MAFCKRLSCSEDKIFTLKELSTECAGHYPAILTVQPPDYEYINADYLSPGTEVLIFKSQRVEYCRIKIQPFNDFNQIGKTKGSEYVSERNKYTGREYLLPLEYPGKLEDSGREGRYTSVSQVIDDLPKYVKLCQMIECVSPKDGNKQFIDQDTLLEVQQVDYNPYKDVSYVVCKTNNNKTVYLKEDCLINGKALFSLSSLSERNTSMPKSVMFELVDPNDVLMHDDDEASDLLLLLGGPISVLNTTSRIVYVAWMKMEESEKSRKLAVIPEQVWSTIVVSLCDFNDEVERKKYIKAHYGDYFGTDFIRSCLYKMLPVEDNIVFITEPRVENLGNYEEPIPLVPPRSAEPKLEQKEVYLLPEHVKNIRDSRLNITHKLSMGFDMVHKQLFDHFDEITDQTSEKRPIRRRRVTHEQFVLPNQTYDPIRRENESGNSELQHRPVKLDQNDHKQGDKLQNVVQPMMASSWQHKTTDANNTLRSLPNVDKISRPNQTKDDFCSYTTNEVVECFKLCGLEVMAKHCHENILDGAFFQHLSATDLQECFDLNSIELYKVNQIINDGWRPKLTG